MKTLSTILGILLLAAVAMAQMPHDMHDMAMPSPGDGQFDPSVVTDNKGGFYLAYIEKTNAGSNLMLRHTVDGKSYSAAVRVNDRPGDAVVRNENPPKLAVGSKGELYASWANERGKYLGNIRFARSVDGGKTFSKAIDLNSDAAGTPAGHAFQSLLVDARGRIYVAWIDERNKKPTDRGEEIWISMSADGGRTFSVNRKILGNVCECCRTAIVEDSQGSIYVSYRSVAPTDPMYRDIVVARSDDGGKTFVPKPVSSDGWDIHACPIAGATMAMDAAGHITVAWFSEGGGKPRLFYTVSTDRGQTFAPRRELPVAQTLAKHAQAVADGDGRIFIAWDDATPANVVQWGVLDPIKGTLKALGTQGNTSYPVIAAGRNEIAVAGLENGAREIFRTVTKD